VSLWSAEQPCKHYEVATSATMPYMPIQTAAACQEAHRAAHDNAHNHTTSHHCHWRRLLVPRSAIIWRSKDFADFDASTRVVPGAAADSLLFSPAVYSVSRPVLSPWRLLSTKDASRRITESQVPRRLISPALQLPVRHCTGTKLIMATA